MLTQIRAPFTIEQVVALNAYQRRGSFHPFTCGNFHEPTDLVATLQGWRCPRCTFTQDWAHEFMAVPACETCGEDDAPLVLTDDLRLFCGDCKDA